MSNEAESQRPAWSPRVSKVRIARLYERCGQGIFDEELIDDVGFSLYARCKSILSATQRLCPSCETPLNHKPEALECPGCGWECPRDVYRKSIKYKHLFAGGMKPFLEEFIQEFPAASSHQQRMILIDTLIHRYHWEFSGGGGRPGACCLVEGKLKNIMPFLDTLSYGNEMPSEVEATRERWRVKWHNSRWDQSKP